jgi:methyl acetate hydrolase
MMKTRMIRTVLALMVCMTWAVEGAAATDPHADISRYLEAQQKAAGIPGFVAAIVDKNGLRYLNAVGKQDVAQNLPLKPNALFRIASMTKPITSLAVMMLVEQGKVGLDDPIEKYLPLYANPRVIETFYPLDGSYTTRPATGSITVKHLLTHTSGLGYGFASQILTLMQGAPPNVRAMPSPLPLLHDPGTAWTYGESTRVLGQLVEKVSGQELEAFMQQNIFAPLGMSDTFYDVPTAKLGRVITVHRWEGGKLVEAANPAKIDSPHNGDGGLSSTAADYAKFIRLFLNGGKLPDGRQLISARTAQTMGEAHTGTVRVRLQEPALPAVSAAFPLGAGRDSYGLGFQVTGAPAVPDQRSPGSLAWAGIFNTEFWIDPSRGIGGILLMQYLPFYDKAAIETLQGFERRVYESLH